MEISRKSDKETACDLLALYGIKCDVDSIDESQLMAVLSELDKAGETMREAERRFVEKFGVNPGWPIMLDMPITPKKRRKRKKARNKHEKGS